MFRLAEGHCLSEKAANTVVSIPNHTLENGREQKLTDASARQLVLHAENCAGQK